MKRSTSLLTLLLAVACSNPTGPGDEPKWADGTSWKSSVTMKSGTTLNISFQLTTGRYTDLMTQHEIWGISVEHARIENALTGRVARQWPEGSPEGMLVTASVRADFALQLTMMPDSTFDPLIPSCPTEAQPGNVPFYRVNLHIAADGTLRGTVELGCFMPGDLIFDSQPIVMRRV